MNFSQKIDTNDFTVGIIGLGYVGLPLALEFAQKKINVIGLDLDSQKIDNIVNKNISYITHISSKEIKKSVETGFLTATTDFSKLAKVDVIIICVPTPLTANREPDMSYILNTSYTIAKYLRSGQLISLESTTYPGTTDSLLLNLFESTGLKVGYDFYLCFSPEREDPNNKDFRISNIPKVIGGITDACLSIGKKVYNKIIDKIVTVSSTRTAEASKLLENIYRSVNIALVNELKIVFSQMGIDIWEVIKAASTKPFGYTPFYPGPGLGGHCIPIDPFYLAWKAKEYGISTRFIELAGEINTFMPYYVIEKVINALNDYGKCLKGTKILILGLSYKKDINDLRESPSLKLMELLIEKGAIVGYNDEYINTVPRLRKYNFNKSSKSISKEVLNDYDLILLSTDHSYYDYEFIYKNSKIIVDTRNAFKDFQDKKIYKA